QRRAGTDAPRKDRSLCTSFAGIQAPSRLPRPLRVAPGQERRSSERHAAEISNASAASPDEGAAEVQQAGTTVTAREALKTASLRSSGGGKPHVSRRPRRGAQLARDAARRASSEVLRLPATRHP